MTCREGTVQEAVERVKNHDLLETTRAEDWKAGEEKV